MVSLRDNDSHSESTDRLCDLHTKIDSLKDKLALVVNTDTDEQRALALEEDIVGRVWIAAEHNIF